MNLNEWQLEQFHHNTYVQGFKISKKLFETHSKYQKISVVETEAVGRLLLLDDKTMVSDADEFVYHELMGHIPLMTVPHAKHVLIIGGGDGGIVREVVKHPDLESVTLVEIDEMVVKVSQEFFPNCTSGLSHPKVQLVMEDGAQFLQHTKQQYDVIIIDSTDPENFASTLFTQEFYQTVKNKLTPQGVMMAQTENPFLDTYSIKNIYNNLRANFQYVHSLSAPMLIYPGVYWSFAYCSQKTSPLILREDKRDFMNQLTSTLKWYNPQWHLGAFQLSNFHMKKIGSLP